MEIAPGQFSGLTENNAFSAPDTYYLNAAGVKAGEYSSLISWHSIQVIEAWKTTGDGNYGWEEIFHIRLRDEQGNNLQISDSAEAGFFTDLQKAINHYLGVEINWRYGQIDADYQQRQRRWHGGWFGSQRKPIVYTRVLRSS